MLPSVSRAFAAGQACFLEGSAEGEPSHACQQGGELELAVQCFAGQMRKSPYSFSSIGDTSPLLWLARRYAILDGPTMPIVAEGDEEPNNTYVEQLTASARAAVQACP